MAAQTIMPQTQAVSAQRVIRPLARRSIDLGRARGVLFCLVDGVALLFARVWRRRDGGRLLLAAGLAVPAFFDGARVVLRRRAGAGFALDFLSLSFFFAKPLPYLVLIQD